MRGTRPEGLKKFAEFVKRAGGKPLIVYEALKTLKEEPTDANINKRIDELKSIKDITHLDGSSVWVDATKLSETKEWEQMYKVFNQIVRGPVMSDTYEDWVAAGKPKSGSPRRKKNALTLKHRNFYWLQDKSDHSIVIGEYYVSINNKSAFFICGSEVDQNPEDYKVLRRVTRPSLPTKKVKAK